MKNIKKFLLCGLIFLFLFLSILFLDNYIFNGSLLKNFGRSINSTFYDLLGVHSALLLFFIFLTLLMTIIPAKAINKIFMTTGLILLIAFIPPFMETYNFLKINNGAYAVHFSGFFKNAGLLQNFLLFFLWFLSSLFFLLFPFKNRISETVSSLFSLIISKNSGNHHEFKLFKFKKRINNGNKTAIPWMSKVIFESSGLKTEIPLIPKENIKIKQFVLTDQDDNTDYYKEIIKVENNENQIELNEKYFENLKKEWPEKWKKNKNEKLLLPEAVNSEINIIINESDDTLTLEEYESIEPVNQNNKAKPILSDSLKNIKYKSGNKSNREKASIYNFPETDILESAKKIDPSIFIAEHKESAGILEDTLLEFGIKAEVCEIINGPVVTLFKLKPAPGIKLQKIESLSNNLALRLAAKSIRIIAPIPGEKVVGIEIPNRTRQLIKFKEIVNSEIFSESDHHIPIGLGKDINGNIIVIDLYKMPHLLIAGATGSGKSVCVNALIASILFSKNPDEVRLLFIDPKIVELKPYNDIPHLLTPVISEPKEAIRALKYLMMEMERRYILFDEMGVRDIVEYHIRKKKKAEYSENIPFIVTIVDEFADLMSTSGKEAEIIFARLAAKARAVGIHLILATQRPSTDVITGLIKANIPARIAFQVISLMNSRIILDQKGAEKLLGQGDMLYISPIQPFPERLQGAFLTKEEVDSITDHWRNISKPNYINIDDFVKDEDNNENGMDFDESDEPLFEEALKIIYQSQKASASYLQRRLGIGYNRAARIIEEMERQGIVGPQNGSKPRDIIKSNHDLFT